MAGKSVASFVLLAVLGAGIFGALSGPAVAQRGARLGAPAPDISGGPWINSEPLSMEKLKGRVVFVEFWTYG